MRIKQRILKEEPGGVNWELELYYFCHWENGMFLTGTENHKLAKEIGIGLAFKEKIAWKIGFIQPHSSFPFRASL